MLLLRSFGRRPIQKSAPWPIKSNFLWAFGEPSKVDRLHFPRLLELILIQILKYLFQFSVATPFYILVSMSACLAYVAGIQPEPLLVSRRTTFLLAVKGYFACCGRSEEEQEEDSQIFKTRHYWIPKITTYRKDVAQTRPYSLPGLVCSVSKAT